MDIWHDLVSITAAKFVYTSQSIAFSSRHKVNTYENDFEL